MGNFGRREIERIHSSNMHRNVPAQILKIFAPRNKISLAADVYQDADFSVCMDIRSHQPFSRRALRPLGCFYFSLFTKNRSGFFLISTGFFQSVFTGLHRNSGSLTERFNLINGNSVRHAEKL
jgi:hypothetical protein